MNNTPVVGLKVPARYVVCSSFFSKNVTCSICPKKPLPNDAPRRLHTVKKEYDKQYPYMAGHRNVCRCCMRELETTHIDEMPIEDLPLWVSHGWLYEENAAHYRGRLEALSHE